MKHVHSCLTHTVGLVLPQIISGERPAIPDSCPPGFKALLQDCWYKQPSKRPSMTQVRREERLLWRIPSTLTLWLACIRCTNDLWLSKVSFIKSQVLERVQRASVV